MWYTACALINYIGVYIMRRRVKVTYVEKILRDLPKGFNWELEVTRHEVIAHIRDDLNMWSHILFDLNQLDNLKETVNHLANIDKLSKDEVD
jgi:hypothetical protein